MRFSEPPAPEDLTNLALWVDPLTDEHDLDGFVAEAIMCGCLVVAGRTATNVRRTAGGTAGFLVPRGDANESAHAIVNALFKPEHAEARRQAIPSAAARLAGSWVISYAYPDQERTTAVVATGAVLSDAQNGRGSPGYIQLSGDALLRLYRATGDASHLELLAENGIHAVVGTSGLDDDDIRRLRRAFVRSNCFVAPNFSIGAVLMTRFAAMAAPFFQVAEIVDCDDDRNAVAPSPFAIDVAQRMADAGWKAAPESEGSPPKNSSTARTPPPVAPTATTGQSFATECPMRA